MGDEVARRADKREVAAHRGGEDQRHQEARAGKAGFGGDADDDGDEDGGGAGVGEEAGHDAGDGHDGDDELPLGFGEAGDEGTDAVRHAGFEERPADDEHGDEEDDVRVHEAVESGFGIEDAGYDQADADGHGGDGERDFLPDEHDDGKKKEQEGDGTGVHGSPLVGPVGGRRRCSCAGGSAAGGVRGCVQVDGFCGWKEWIGRRAGFSPPSGVNTGPA